MKTRKMIKNEKGGAAVEFAIVLPLIAVLLFGIIEFSLLFYNKAMITNASREGARKGIVYFTKNRTPEEIRNLVCQTVIKYCADHLITFGSNTFSCPSGTCELLDHSPTQKDLEDKLCAIEDVDGSTDLSSGDSLTVRVTYTYDFLVFPNLIKLLQGTYSDTQDLTAVTVMRLE